MPRRLGTPAFFTKMTSSASSSSFSISDVVAIPKAVWLQPKVAKNSAARYTLKVTSSLDPTRWKEAAVPGSVKGGRFGSAGFLILSRIVSTLPLNLGFSLKAKMKASTVAILGCLALIL